MPNTDANLPAVQDDRVFRLMDAMDDDLIKAELENRITNVWAYSFQQQGKTVTGLSKSGVDAACNEFAKSGHVIEESPARFEVDPVDSDYVLFTVTATRYLVNLETGQRIQMETVNGAKRQYTKMKRGNSFTTDPFYFEKGVSKAARNARSRLIPEEVKAAILAMAKEGGKVKQVENRSLPEETTKTKDPTPVYAEGTLKKFLEAWIKEYLMGDRESFKAWAFANDQIDTNEDGEPTLNKVKYAFAQRIKTNPQGAEVNFKTWLVQNELDGEELNGQEA